MEPLADFAGLEEEEQSSAPLSNEDQGNRREGWRAFLTEVRTSLQDPVKGAVITQLLAQMSQDRQPGQSGSDQFGRAVQDASNAGRLAEEGINKQTLSRREQDRKDQELGLEQDRVQQAGDIAQRREEGLDRRNEANTQLSIKQEQARTARDERQHLARMQNQDRALSSRLASLDAQLQQSKISAQERQVLLEQRNNIEKSKLALQRAELGDRSALSLLELSTEMATSTDINDITSVDKAEQRRLFTMMAKTLGLENTELNPEADLVKARKAVQQAMKIGQEQKLSSAEIRELLAKVSSLDEATRSTAINLLDQQVADEGPDVSTESVDADGGTRTNAESGDSADFKNAVRVASSQASAPAQTSTSDGPRTLQDMLRQGDTSDQDALSDFVKEEKTKGLQSTATKKKLEGLQVRWFKLREKLNKTTDEKERAKIQKKMDVITSAAIPSVDLI